jgi:hypothetical protein
METRNIISFYDLSDKWQDEARLNLGDLFAEENYYLEPLPEHNSKDHILYDLHECMRHEGVTEDGFKYNCVIGISNNSALLLNIDSTFETANIKFV